LFIKDILTNLDYTSIFKSFCVHYYLSVEFLGVCCCLCTGHIVPIGIVLFDISVFFN